MEPCIRGLLGGFDELLMNDRQLAKRGSKVEFPCTVKKCPLTSGVLHGFGKIAQRMAGEKKGEREERRASQSQDKITKVKAYDVT